jgi:Nucleotidyl transferase AbiEii toxin, Type IV TA system
MAEEVHKTGVAGEPPLPDKVIAIHEALREAKIAHALGGALALAYYAEPRTTVDIDINVFVPVERWPTVVDALTAIGVDTADLDSFALERDEQCRLWWGRNPVDVFFSYAPIHEEMRKESRRVPFAGTTVPILSPEHLAVCKAMFNRPKDWIDIGQMLVATDGIDFAKIEEWLKRMVGETDFRIARLEELKAD